MSTLSTWLVADATLLQQVISALLRIGVVLAALLGLALPGMVYFERKISAWIQGRLGPNRVGPFGLLQVLADGIKLIFKEDLAPKRAVKLLFLLGPAFSFLPTFMAMAVIPFGFYQAADGMAMPILIADVDIGVIYLLAVASLAVYGILIGGWASSNKYTLMGGLRSSAQAISYEIPLGLSVIGIVMLAGSAKLGDIVAAQESIWFVFPAHIGFWVFFICIFAETNRLPFDLPEGETEIIGFHIEYSSMKFATFYMVEYAHMILGSALSALLFFGGWELLPWYTWNDLAHLTGWDFYGVLWFIPSLWLVAKIALFLFVFIWVRWTLPRFRYDQLMSFGWTKLLPVSLINLAVVAVYMIWTMKG